MVNNNQDLSEYLNNLDIESDLKKIISVISSTCYEISEEIRLSNINNLVGKTGEINVQGEQVEKLDELANNLLIKNLSETGKVFLMGSEEIESVIIPNPNNKNAEFIVVFDPLDGSSNIDVSVTIGTIFAIYKRVNSDQNDDSNLLQEGNKAIAAGYTVYGSSTVMCISTKEDTSMFSFDKKGLPTITNPKIIGLPPFEDPPGKNLLILSCKFFIISSMSGGVGPLLPDPFPPPGGLPHGLPPLLLKSSTMTLYIVSLIWKTR